MLIYFNVRGSNAGGGPTTFAYKAAAELVRRGHAVTYSPSNNVDAAICIINAEKALKQMPNAKILLRIDGIYNELYNQKFGRAIRPDMTALHDELKRTIPAVQHVCYQSAWSRDRIQDEIVKVNADYSIIHNGVDTNLFKPLRPYSQATSGYTSLIHVGCMRDRYLMEMLVGTYVELGRNRGYNVRLVLAGPMDAQCKSVLKQHGADSNIVLMGNIPNNKLPDIYGRGDIFLDVRQGASCNNVVAEAQACGVPVISPIWGGSAEMIVDGVTGCVVDGGQWDYDADYIDKLSDAAEEIMLSLNDFKARARAHAVNNLTVGAMMDKYIKAMAG